jgi:hypothetical protein
MNVYLSHQLDAIQYSFHPHPHLRIYRSLDTICTHCPIGESLERKDGILYDKRFYCNVPKGE